MDIAAEPLSKTFPKPDYEKLAEDGVPKDMLSLVALMRDEIPTKPRVPYRLRTWVTQVKALRAFSAGILGDKFNEALGGDTSLASLRAFAEQRAPGLGSLFDTAELIAQLDIPVAEIPKAAVYRVHHSPTRGSFLVRGSRMLGLGDYGETTVQDPEEFRRRAITRIESDLAAARDKPKGEGKGRSKQTEIVVRIWRKGRGGVLMWRPRGKLEVLKDGFANYQEAKDYLEAHRDELQAEIDRLRKGPSMRKERNAPRKGPDHRAGDATAEMFTEAFGFRGVQFGNWVEGGQRQQDVNEAYDALFDLADVLGVPTRALSLNGELGLAFGARGKGGRAKAHYESDHVVINLTKTAGPGSLAHEWLHALDNYFARMAGGKGRAFMSDPSLRPKDVSALRDEVVAAWKGVHEALDKGSFAKRAAEYDKARGKDYWGTPIEKAARAFERYVVDALNDRGVINDYLANIDLSGGAYPTGPEMRSDGIQTAYDRLFATLEATTRGDKTALSEPGNVYYPSAYDAEAATLPGREGDSGVSESQGDQSAAGPAPVQGELDFYAPVGKARPSEKLLASRIVNGEVGVYRSGITRLGQDTTSAARDVAHIVAPLRKSAQENLLAVVTDADGRVLGILRHTMGGPSAAAVYPSFLLGAAADIDGARRIWFAHQHPSGKEAQSKADHRLTERMAQLAQGSGLSVEGMVVVTPGGQMSFSTPGSADSFSRIPTARRQEKLPVYERVARRIDPRSLSITTPKEAAGALERYLGAQSGILLLNVQHHPVAVLPMLAADMKRLRRYNPKGPADTPAGRLFRAIHRSNAEAILARAPGNQRDEALAQNLEAFARDADIGLMDVIQQDNGDSYYKLGLIKGAGPHQDTFFMFAGARARTANRMTLERAQAMLAEGKSADQARRATGWFLGDDGYWRFEIDDSDAVFHDINTALSPGYLQDVRAGDWGMARLGDILTHPALFAAYPDLKHVDVSVQHGFQGGAFQARHYQLQGPLIKTGVRIAGDRVYLDKGQQDTILHEIQHALQHVEQFASGGSPEAMARVAQPPVQLDDISGLSDAARLAEKIEAGQAEKDALHALTDEIGVWRAGSAQWEWERRGRPSAEALRDELEQTHQLYDAQNDPYSMYERIAGEIEARNTVTRRGLAATERREIGPELTRDIPRAQSIVLMNGRAVRAAPENLIERSVPRESLDQPPGVSVEQARAEVRRIAGAWRNAPPIEVVGTEDGLPGAVRKAIRDSGGSGAVHGVYWRGKAYVVAGNLSHAGAVERVLLHEVIGHYGLHGLVGDRVEPLLEEVYRSYGPDGLRDIAQRYGLDFRRREHRLEAAEEKIAHMAQTGERPGLMRRILAVLRDWLRRAGFRMRLSDTDLLHVIARARRFVERGEILHAADNPEPSFAAGPESDVPVIVVPPLAAKPESLYREARSHYKEHVQGRTVYNESLGHAVDFTRAGGSKVLATGRLDARRMRLVSALPEIVARAHFFESQVARTGTRGVRIVHRGVVPVEIDGDLRALQVTLREHSDGRHRFYTVTGFDFVEGNRGRQGAGHGQSAPPAVSILGTGSATDSGLTGHQPWPETGGQRRHSVNVGELVDAVKNNRPLFARFMRAPGFRSALADTVDSIDRIADKEGQVKVDQARQWLAARQKEGRFKADELYWSGLGDWLDTQKGKVPVSSVRQFLDEHGVQVHEVRLAGEEPELDPTDLRVIDEHYTTPGDPSEVSYTIEHPEFPEVFTVVVDRDAGNVYVQRDGGAFLEVDAPPNRQDFHDAKYAITKYIERSLSQPGVDGPAIYGEYTVPGGENYQEMLLTVPDPSASSDYVDVARDLGYPAIKTQGDFFSLPQDARTAIAQEARKRMGLTFHSEHWSDATNVAVHVRFDERTANDGKRVLFIEEIQSDWAQQGRRFGFIKKQERKAALVRLQQVEGELKKLYEEMRADTVQPDEAARLNERVRTLRAEQDRLDEKIENGVPEGPFLQNTEAWTALALKRMLTYASENGFDRVMWTDGRTQADRYDLSKQVSRVTLTNRAPGNGVPDEEFRGGMLRAYDHANHQVVEEHVRSPEDVERYVGKEVAQKLLAQQGAVDKPKGSAWTERVRTVHGLELRVGGEGMHVYYDKIVPQVANKILKRHGGGRTHEGVVPGVVREVSEEPDGSTSEAFYAQPIGARPITGDQDVLGWAVDITDNVNRSINGGLPLFARGEPDPQTEREMEAGTEEVKRRQQSFVHRLATQPLDTAFRIPFDVTGLVNDKGEFKGGAAIDEGLHKFIVEWKPDPDGNFRWLNYPLEAARAGLIDRYGLSEEYKRRSRQAEAEERRGQLEMIDVLKKLERSGVDAHEARVLQAVLTGERIADGDWAEIAEPIRRAIDTMGQEAVNLGLISAESYEANRGTYLHRSYLKHETAFTGLSSWAHRTLSARRKKIVGDSLRGRGIDWKVDGDRLLKDVPPGWWGLRRRRGQPDTALHGRKFRILDLERPRGEDSVDLEGVEPGGDPHRIVQRVYWPADIELPKQYEAWHDRGTFQVRRFEGNKVVLWRDYTKAEREKMGEILDARYNIAKTFQHMSHDLAAGRFFKDIAENPEWFRKDVSAREGVSITAGTASRLRTYSGVDWVHVPASKIPGSQAYHWGALAGGYVRPEIWRDLNELDRMQRRGTWNRVLTQWKLNKTARNPVVHMNNVMSNVMLMDLADVRLPDFLRGIRSYITQDEHYRDAMEHGAFGGTFISAEIRKEILEPLLAEIEQQARGGKPGIDLKVDVLSRFAYGLWTAYKKFDRSARELYQAEDEVFRMATYMRRRALGDAPEAAARIAREQFLDYDIRAPWVNAARAGVLPFIAYTYRATPMVARAIAHRPWKLAKYYAIVTLIQTMSYALAPGDEDKERRSMRDEVQGWTWVATPRMVRMPWRDHNGNPVFLDVRRWIPAGDIFDLNQGSSAIPVPAPLQLGGPIMLASELFLNKQGFTGEPITKPATDTPFEEAEKIGGWAWKSWMPSAAWVPGSWYWDKIWRAAEGGKDVLGRRYSIPQAFASSMGIKLNPQDVELGLAWHALKLRQARSEIEFEARQLQRDRARNLITPADYARGMQRIREKMLLLEQEARDLAGQAQK